VILPGEKRRVVIGKELCAAVDRGSYTSVGGMTFCMMGKRAFAVKRIHLGLREGEESTSALGPQKKSSGCVILRQSRPEGKTAAPGEVAGKKGPAGLDRKERTRSVVCERKWPCLQRESAKFIRRASVRGGKV